MTPKPGYYSPHFSRVELLASEAAARRNISNVPSPAIEKNLERLCKDFLEPIRARFGPIRVTSGYRCSALNAVIGGSATSAHVDGRAADIQLHDPTFFLSDVMRWLKQGGLPFDQAILEYGGWVHLGIAKEGVEPRRRLLMIFSGTGYMNYDAADTRVK